MKYRLPALLLITALYLPATYSQETAPLFSGVDVRSGEPVNLADLKGKVVYIDFWASWCPPCLASLPAYDKMRDNLGTEDFEIIAINVDEDTEDGLNFLEDNPVSYPVLADPEGTIGKPYGIRSLPVSYLLDRQGAIVATYKSFKPGEEVEIQEDIEALLNR